MKLGLGGGGERGGRGAVTGMVLILDNGGREGDAGWICDGVGGGAGGGSVVGAVAVSTFVGYLATLAAVAGPLAIALLVESLAFDHLLSAAPYLLLPALALGAGGAIVAGRHVDGGRRRCHSHEGGCAHTHASRHGRG